MSNDRPDQVPPNGDVDDTRPQHPVSPPPAAPAPPPQDAYDGPARQEPRPGPRPFTEQYAGPYDSPFGPTTTATTLVPVAPSGGGRGPIGSRRRFAAGIIAASLLVGGGAGVGGAAAWNAFSDSSSSGGTLAGQVSSASPAVSTGTTDGSVESVAAKVLPSVVKIEVSGAQGSGSGSGIILSADGQILTNNHVVEVAKDGGTLSVAFNDGTFAKATVLGTDPLTDTALIQAEGVSDLTPASIGTSGDLKVGQGVVAIGSPFGLESTVTSGIVSALNRPVDVGSDSAGNTTTYPAIQTDAAINPGNSGGALTDMAGNVVGINASIRTAGATTPGGAAGSIGLGFAIPIDEVLPIVQQMADGQTPTHAKLGVSVADLQGGKDAPLSEGAAIKAVNAGSTAAAAGIAVGDVITRVDDRLISGADSLVATIRSYRPGDEVTVTYTSGGATKTAQLTLDSDEVTSNS